MDYPLKYWGDKAVQDFFCKTVDMKTTGYWSFSEKPVVPIDQTDFVGTNFIICYDTPTGLVPLMGYRSIEATRCEYHRLNFPPKGILELNKVDTTVLDGILSSARSQKRRVCYKSSWTKSEHCPKSKESSLFIRDLITTIAVNYMKDSGIDEWLTCGTVKNKTDQYFTFLGMSKITPNFNNFGFFDNEIVMLHMKDSQLFTKEALEIAARLNSFWENKLVIGEQFGDDLSIAA